MHPVPIVVIPYDVTGNVSFPVNDCPSICKNLVDGMPLFRCGATDDGLHLTGGNLEGKPEAPPNMAHALIHRSPPPVPLLELDRLALLVVIVRVGAGFVPAIYGAEQHSGLLRLRYPHGLIEGGSPLTGRYPLGTGASRPMAHLALGDDDNLVSRGRDAEALLRQ